MRNWDDKKPKITDGKKKALVRLVGKRGKNFVEKKASKSHGLVRIFKID